MAASLPARVGFAFSGLIIWAVHLLALYGLTGLACDLIQHGDDRPFVLAIVFIGAIAVVLLLLVIIAACTGKGLARPPAGTRTNLVLNVAVAGAGFALAAVVWETIAIASLPACS